ncbi:MAG: hypothetical protein JWL82_63 [Parcubacteria group bacterium]|nr:hypothetical protein [Parcubacteria group bacterium]
MSVPSHLAHFAIGNYAMIYTRIFAGVAALLAVLPYCYSRVHGISRTDPQVGTFLWIITGFLAVVGLMFFIDSVFITAKEEKATKESLTEMITPMLTWLMALLIVIARYTYWEPFFFVVLLCCFFVHKLQKQNERYKKDTGE